MNRAGISVQGAKTHPIAPSSFPPEKARRLALLLRGGAAALLFGRNWFFNPKRHWPRRQTTKGVPSMLSARFSHSGETRRLSQADGPERHLRNACSSLSPVFCSCLVL